MYKINCILINNINIFYYNNIVKSNKMESEHEPEVNVEHDILINIYDTINELLNNICASKIIFNKLNNDINTLNNAFFTKDNNIKTTTMDTLLENIVDIETKLENSLVECKEDAEYRLGYICRHDWIFDLIDITPDKSQYIPYCSICEVTKR